MKALVLTGSRADRNCQEMVWEALNAAGHQAALVPFHSMGEGTPVMRDEEIYSAANIAAKLTPDVVVVAGDRIEVLKMAVYFAELGLPICHISGGDVTEGSADDRYRDAITQLACIHCTETMDAFNRLQMFLRFGDRRYCTGNPALDRIRQTPVLSRQDTFTLAFNNPIRIPEHGKPVALVCVHPNTTGDDPLADYRAVWSALVRLEMQCICIGANADPGGAEINRLWEDFCRSTEPMRSFHQNVSPQVYYSLMQHCDVMIGNSSAMLCEAPLFNLPCLLVGHRQDGRPIPANVFHYMDLALPVDSFNLAFRYDRSKPVVNPYGDGHSAPRVVKALEENSWRWTNDNAKHA